MEILKRWQAEIEYLGEVLPKMLKDAQNVRFDYDPSENDYLFEVYDINKRKFEHFTLCRDIGVHLSEACYPGEKLTRLQIARRFTNRMSDKSLKKIIKALKLNPSEQISFKVSSDAPTLREVEEVLTPCISEGGFVEAKYLSEKLQVCKTSKCYATVKKKMSEAGWVWRSRRINGIKVKVIEPPKIQLEPSFDKNEWKSEKVFTTSVIHTQEINFLHEVLSTPLENSKGKSNDSFYQNLVPLTGATTRPASVLVAQTEA
jgi:hypothetical protein